VNRGDLERTHLKTHLKSMSELKESESNAVPPQEEAAALTLGESAAQHSYFYYDFSADLVPAACTTGDRLSDIGNRNFFKSARWSVEPPLPDSCPVILISFYPSLPPRSPDGTRLLTNSNDDILRIFEL